MITARIFKETATFTSEDVAEMVAEIDMYMNADNLPKWLMAAGFCYSSKKAVIAKMRELDKENASIDLRSS